MLADLVFLLPNWSLAHHPADLWVEGHANQGAWFGSWDEILLITPVISGDSRDVHVEGPRAKPSNPASKLRFLEGSHLPPENFGGRGETSQAEVSVDFGEPHGLSKYHPISTPQLFV